MSDARHPAPVKRVEALAPYAPGLSIAEIRDKYNLANVVKLASNENPLGASPLAMEAIAAHAANAFRYPQGGNPRLARALAEKHGVSQKQIAIGNGSDEIIDILIRILANPGQHNIVCFKPCFSIYPIQAAINGVECRQQPLENDFSFDFAKLVRLADENTRLVFITTPDNPSGYLPPLSAVKALGAALALAAPEALLVIDEAYMDFASNEHEASWLVQGGLAPNAAILRTFSKSYGLAGLRIGYAVLPPAIADGYWRARLPFSLNILAEAAALAALNDGVFRELTLRTTLVGREEVSRSLRALGCRVWPSQANFVMFEPPAPKSANDCFEFLLRNGVIIRPLKSYGLPGNLRVSIGNKRENQLFLNLMRDFLR